MSDTVHLLRRPCAHHPEREAVGRCPECGHTFCRECITDHEGRVICATCLENLRDQGPENAGGFISSVKHVMAMMAGLLLAIAFYYGLGWVLLQIPEKFHEGRWYFVSEEE